MRSPSFQSLYGPGYADELEGFLRDLDPELNSLVQTFAYNGLWAREGLSLREKSVVTLSALVANGRTEQISLHMRGFLHSCGNAEDLRNILIHLIGYCGFPPVLTAFRVLRDVLNENRLPGEPPAERIGPTG